MEDSYVKTANLLILLYGMKLFRKYGRTIESDDVRNKIYFRITDFHISVSHPAIITNYDINFIILLLKIFKLLNIIVFLFFFCFFFLLLN